MTPSITTIQRNSLAALALLLSAAAPCLAQQPATPEVHVTAANPLGIARSNETIEVAWNDLADHLPGLSADKVSVFDVDAGQEAVCQVLDPNGDDKPDMLLFQADFTPKQRRTFTIRAVASKAQADPSPVYAKFVPTRMDDFAWESDRIAYRVYGPALRVETISNGIDVWGKRVRYPIIEKWYQSGEYHQDHGEGADLFKVGNTLGCGGSAIWTDGQLHRGENFAKWRILANGPVRTLFELTYEPLEVDGVTIRETKRYSLDAGHNLTRLATTYTCDPPAKTLDFAAGLVKRPDVKRGAGDKAPWIALWGPIGETGDGELGTGVVMTPDVFNTSREIGEHLVAIGTAKVGEPVVYWAGAGWTRSGDFKDADAWNTYLDEWSRRIAEPLVIKVGP